MVAGTKTNERIDMIDILRGFALIGLPFANIIALWGGHLQISGEAVDIYIQRFIYIFIEGRFFAIFSFLFGVGVWIFYERAKQKQLRPLTIYIRRMVILLLVGLIHQFFQPGEALMIYAILGFFLPFFFRQPKTFNLLAGTIGIVLGSIFHAKVFLPFPYMILGIAFAQYHMFTNMNNTRRKWQIAAIVTGILSVIVCIYLWLLAPAEGQTAFIENMTLTDTQIIANQSFYFFTKTALLFAPITTAFYVCVIVLFGEKLSFITKGLKAYGRTAFTNYVMQTCLLLITLSFILNGQTIGYVEAFLTCLSIVIVQIIGSTIWLRYFHYGLFEWLWRCGTYKSMLPLKR